MPEIFFCQKCNKYMMRPICSCKEKTISTIPLKYSPGKLLEYRIKARRKILEENGFL